MSYAISDILNWAAISQPLARFYENKKRATIGGSQEKDLDLQIYNARKDLIYAYAQDPTADETFTIGQYVLALCGVYLFQAQATSGGGGSISPIVNVDGPEPYDFEVSSTSFITTGQTSKTISAFIGYNIIFVRNGITQSTVNLGGTYYSWDRTSGLFTLYGGAAGAGELFQIYPIQ